MKTDPRTDTLLKTYLVYILVLVFGIAIIASTCLSEKMTVVWSRLRHRAISQSV